MKGAPELILALCDNYWMDGEIHYIDTILELGRKGERVFH